jgi:BirA family biotin operon repressor/biotin-[acetyl-CoA-carboxylase] ligase
LHGLLFGYEQWQKKGIDALLPSYVELMAYRDRSITIDGKPGTIIGVSPKGELRVCLQTEGSEVASASQITSSNDLEVLLKPGTISLGYKT